MMLRNVFFRWMILAIALLFLNVYPASAGHGVWTSQGPEGGSTQALVVTRGRPSVLYAGVFQGVYKSTDGGQTWRRVSQAIKPQILSLAGDPGDPQTLYAGTTPNSDTPVGGVFKTTNGGRTWRHLTLPNHSVTALAISPAAPATVWAGTDAGLYVSRDAGASWSLIEAIPPSFFTALAAHPTRGGTLYASGQTGLFKTEDGGEHWSRLNDDLPSNGPDALAIDPAHPDRIYIGGQFYPGVLRSDDGGITWQSPTTDISPYSVRALVVDPIRSTVYAAPWSAPELVYKSTDLGESWTPAGRGLPATLILSLVLDPSDPSALYAGSLAGVWKSTDRSASWAPANRGIRHTSVRAIAVDPSAPGTVLATADYAGVFKSTDRGASWTFLGGSGLDAGPIEALEIVPSSSPTSPATLYAGMSSGLFRSTDGGVSWSHLGIFASVHDLAQSLLGAVYAATDNGVFRSTDGGESWLSVWPPEPGGDDTVRQITVSPARPSDVYLTAPSGVYVSFDGGETWTQGNLTLTPFAVVADPVRPSIAYVSLGGGGVFKSFDSGMTWTSVGSGLPATTILNLVIDPLHPDTIYAGSFFGVYRSVDGGVSWAPLRNGDGTGPTQVQALALDVRGRLTVYAGTGQNGVFDRTLGNPPPPGDFLTTGALPGYRFKVLITAPGQPPRPGRQERDCLPGTLCVSGAVAGQTEVLVRVSGLRANGYSWLSLVRFTPAQVELWAERPATGDRRYYRLDAVPAGSGDLSGLLDRTAFPWR